MNLSAYLTLLPRKAGSLIGVALLVLAASIIAGSGCGGRIAPTTATGSTGTQSTNATGTTSTTSTGATGSSTGSTTGGQQTVSGAQFQVSWPARTRQLDHGLTSALSVAVTLKGATSDGKDVTVNIDRNTAPAAYTGTYIVSQPILTTTSRLTATFYAGPAEANPIVGVATAAVSVSGTNLNLALIVVVGTIKTVAVTPATLTVGGGTTQLSFAAQDVNGAAVAVTPGSAAFKVISGGAYLTATPDGIATPVAPGVASVTATVDGITSPAATVTVNETAPILATSPWPKFHATLAQAGVGVGSPGTGAPEWTFAAGGSMAESSPAIAADGTIYIGSQDDNLYALTSTGSKKWGYKTGGPVLGAPAAASDGTVYVGSEDGYLYAINAAGTLKWRVATPVGQTVGNIAGGITIGSDGTVYAVSEYVLYAVTPLGAVKWAYTMGAGTLPVHGCPAIGPDGTIYVGGSDIYVYAISPSGSLVWQAPTTGNIVYSSPAIGSDGTIYIGSSDGYVWAFSHAGVEKWFYQFSDGGIDSTPAIGLDGTIYVGEDNGQMLALTSTGTLKWHYNTGASIQTSAAIGSNGNIYFIANSGAQSGTSAAWGLSPTGQSLFTSPLGSAQVYHSSPAIGADGTIYFGASDSNVYALY